MAEIAMAGVLFAASYFDWRTEKIPNRIILIGLLPVSGALVQSNNLQEIFWRVISMGMVFFICWLIYLLRGLGAGDVKLLVLLAGVCGLSNLFSVVVIAFSLAGLLAVTKLLFFHGRKSLVETHTVILAPFFTLGYLLNFAEGWWM